MIFVIRMENEAKQCKASAQSGEEQQKEGKKQPAIVAAYKLWMFLFNAETMAMPRIMQNFVICYEFLIQTPELS